MALVTDFQSCCTASILYGFGQEAAADYAARREGNGKDFNSTKSSILQRVKERQRAGDGLVTAITTNNQENAIKALTEIGFLNSGEVHKNRHSENTICLWWLPLKDWVEPVVEVEAPVVKNIFAQPQVEGAWRPRRLLGYHYKIGIGSYLAGTCTSGWVKIAGRSAPRKLYTSSQQAEKINMLRRQMNMQLITVEAVYAN